MSTMPTMSQPSHATLSPLLTFVTQPPLTVVRAKVAASQPRRPRTHGRVRVLHTPVSRCTTPTSPETATTSTSTTSSPLPTTRRRYTKHLPLLITLLTLPLLPLLKSPLTYLTAISTQLPKLQATFLVAFTNFFTVLFCFPANMALMIAAGAILGPLPAFLALFSSKLLAALSAFVLTRRLLTTRANNFLKARPRLAKVLQSGTGWRFVVLMRLSPFPGFMLNYLLAITDVHFWEYVLGTFVGTLPSVLNLVLVGDAARDVSMGISGVGVAGASLSLFIKVLCALSMVFVTVLVTRKVRHVFKEFDDEADVVEA